MINQINYKRIGDLLIEFYANQERLNSAKQLVLIPPIQPEIVECQQDWDSYLKLYNKFCVQYNDRDSEIEIVSNTIELIKSSIKELIPPNTWVRVNDHYVGYETDTWPMHVPELKIVKAYEKVELPTLKHRISS